MLNPTVEADLQLCKATGKTEFQNLKEMAKVAEREA